jgi:hypothetical protein
MGPRGTGRSRRRLVQGFRIFQVVRLRRVPPNGPDQRDEGIWRKGVAGTDGTFPSLPAFQRAHPAFSLTCQPHHQPRPTRLLP